MPENAARQCFSRSVQEEKEALAAQFERSRRASCASCGCVPEEMSGAGGGAGGSAAEGGGGAAGSAAFRRPRAVYPRPTPSEQAAREKALQQLTTVASARLNGRPHAVPIVQRELQIDAHTEPEMKPVCAVPTPPTPAPSDVAVMRDRVRRQQPLIMHRNPPPAQSQLANRMVAQHLLLQQQQQLALQQQQQQKQREEQKKQQQEKRNKEKLESSGKVRPAMRERKHFFNTEFLKKF